MTQHSQSGRSLLRRSRLSSLVGTGLALVAAILFQAGCSNDSPSSGLAKGCTVNSDCEAPLVCGLGLCHAECKTDTDCTGGARCVASGSANVCLLEQETKCTYTSQCTAPLVCGVDRQCRNQCVTDRDCLHDQVCSDHVCASTSEVDPNGHLKGAVLDGGGAGGATGAGGTVGSGGTGSGGEGTGGSGAGGESSGGVTGAGGRIEAGGATGTGGEGAGGAGTGGALGSGGSPDAGPCVDDAACTAVGEVCSGATHVTCEVLADGCRHVVGTTPCDTHQTCTGAPGAATCTCAVDPSCAADGTACQGSKLVTCATDTDGCHYVSASTDCVVPPHGSAAACALGACAYTCDANYVATAAGCDLSYASVAVGSTHACGIRHDGTLWCWGMGTSGQLGDGTSTDHLGPTQIGTDTWKKVSVYAAQTLGIKSDGTLWAWGTNTSHQLGLGTNRSEPVPRQIGVATTWTDVAAGSGHGCAVNAAGALYCWGTTPGDGYSADRYIPGQVGTVTTWTAVVAGDDFSCGRQSDGSLWCWGFNGNGRLGDGTTGDHTAPQPLFGGAKTWASIAAGSDHACAVKTDHTLWCWGNNASGDLGRASPASTNVPLQVGTGTTWASVSVGAQHTCALATDSTLWCFGSGTQGELGGTTSSSAPVQVGSDKWTRIASGGGFSCGVRSDGSATCFGTSYALGNALGSTTTATPTPVSSNPCTLGTSVCSADAVCDYSIAAGVTCTCKPGYTGNGQACSDVDECTQTPAPCDANATCTNTNGSFTCACNAPFAGDGVSCDARWASVSAGETTVCGIRVDGSLWCWGSNSQGETGDGTSTVRLAPVRVGTSAWTQVSVGQGNVAAVRSDGTLWAWGQNDYGRLGIGVTDSPVRLPWQVGNDTNWATVAMGSLTSCGIKTDGTLYCWGSLNSQGNEIRSIPAPFDASTWSSVVSGYGHLCAIRSNGALYCWGQNDVGQLGTGSANSVETVPAQVFGGGTWKSVSAGLYSTCAVRSDSTLWCWGDNSRGQIGRASPAKSNVPLQVGSGTTWASTSVGYYVACATQTNGTLWCFGDDTQAQFGDGSSASSSAPVQVGFVLGNDAPPSAGRVTSDWTAVSQGSGFACGLRTGGLLRCWGNYNTGDGTQNGYLVSVAVSGNPCTTAGNPCDPHAICSYTVASGVACDCATGYYGNGYICADVDECGTGAAACSTHASCGAASGSYTCSCDATYVGDGVTCDQPYVSAALGYNNACAIRQGGALLCWGQNTSGSLGDGTTTASGLPEIIGAATWTKVEPGTSTFTVGLQTNGTLWSWGSNQYGELGNGDAAGAEVHAPAQVGAATTWSDVAAGSNFACALQGGTLYCWGMSPGNANASSFILSPTKIGAVTTWQSVVARQSAACGLRTGGALYCWGDNSYGQIGTGSTAIGQYTAPQAVTGGASTWKAVTTGETHTCAIGTDGTLWCWGYNAYGQLGRATPTESATPLKVGTATTWSSVAAGLYFTCGTQTDGSLWCWGDNSSGMFGDGSALPSATPVRVGFVAGREAPLSNGHITSDWTSVVATGSATCALRTNKTLWCWGSGPIGVPGSGGGGGNGSTPIPLQVEPL